MSGRIVIGRKINLPRVKVLLREWSYVIIYCYLPSFQGEIESGDLQNDRSCVGLITKKALSALKTDIKIVAYCWEYT